jgi:flavin reductase (DIM6/NTAB) family NADH-FMN oxidoreductase RutF
MSAQDGDRFADAEVIRGQEGALLLHGASAWLETSIAQVHPAGDHQLVLLRIHGVAVHPHLPMIFHQSRFRRIAD